MSGSTPGISREKGGVQVREMMGPMAVAVKEPTAGRRPILNIAGHALYNRGGGNA